MKRRKSSRSSGRRSSSRLTARRKQSQLQPTLITSIDIPVFGRNYKLELVPMITIFLFSLFSLCFLFGLKKFPSFTSNIIVGTMMPLYGTIQIVFQYPIDTMMASLQHWQYYWSLLFASLILDHTVLSPLSMYLIPSTYAFFKSMVLAWLFLPQTHGLNYVLYHSPLYNNKSWLSDWDYRQRQINESHNKWKGRIQKQTYVIEEIVKTEASLVNVLGVIDKYIAKPILIGEYSIVWPNNQWDNPRAGEVIKNFLRTWERLLRVHTLINTLLSQEVKIFETEETITFRWLWEKINNELVQVGSKKKLVKKTNVAALSNVLKILRYATNELLPTVYADYCGMYHLAERIIGLERQRNVSFEHFLLKKIELVGADLHKHGLQIHMIRPIQRICRYPLLLEELRKTVTPGCETEKRLLELKDDMSRLADYANSEALFAQNMLVMARVNAKLKFAKNSTKSDIDAEKIMSDPQFRRELYLSKSCDRQALSLDFDSLPVPGMGAVFVQIANLPPKVYHVLLYNDILLLATVKLDRRWLQVTDKYYLVQCILPMHGGSSGVVKTEAQDNVSDFLLSRKPMFTLRIKNRSWKAINDEITIGFYNPGDRDYWLQNVEDAIEYSSKTPDSTKGIFEEITNQYMLANLNVLKSNAHSEEDRFLRREKAIQIQKFYRGSSARALYKQKLERREGITKAVLALQSFVAGDLTRR